MAVPEWVREPFGFLRYILPGFIFLGFAGAFFPRTLDSATRALSFVAGRSDLIAIMWLAWVVVISVVFGVFYRVVYEFVLRPSPRAEELLRDAFDRATGRPHPMSRAEARVLYALVAERFADEAGARWARREANLVDLASQAMVIMAMVGGFLIASPQNAPLVTARFSELEGAVLVAVALGMLFYLRLRDGVIQRAEAAVIDWEDRGTVAFLEGRYMGLKRASGELPAGHVRTAEAPRPGP